MIGIYKITNKINGKSYIGQSNNIYRRFKEHCRRDSLIIDQAIKKYGKENFNFEVIEECSLDKLNEKEVFWIKYFETNMNGYNLSLGGEQQSSGENNGRSILKEEDILFIRISYKNHKKRKDIYEYFKDKISFSTFAKIWDGSSWSNIMPEVFAEENKRYYSKEATNGEKSSKAKLTDIEVIKIRERYVLENARSIYKDFENRCSYNSIQQILWGRTYKHLPIYKKKEKEWINK